MLFELLMVCLLLTPYSCCKRVQQLNNCLQCVQSVCCQKCEKCKDGFTLQNWKCESTSLSQATIVIIIFVILVIFALGIFAIISFLVKRRQQQQKEVAQQIDPQQSRIPTQKSMREQNLDFQQCPICLQEDSNIITKCRHHLHPLCLTQWYAKKRICPVCREILADGDQVSVFCVLCRRELYEVKIVQLSQMMTKGGFGVCKACQQPN